MAVLQCRAYAVLLSRESLKCHFDWDSDHPPPTYWQCHLTSYNLPTVGKQAFPVSSFPANLCSSLRAHVTAAPSLSVSWFSVAWGDSSQQKRLRA